MGQRESTSSPSTVTEKSDDGVAWWLKLLVKTIGVIAGLAAIVLGIFACITITPICMGAGVIQIFSGCIILLLEAPCCCQFFELTVCINKFADGRTFWQKGLCYILIGIPAIILCFEVSTFIGSGAIFVTGTLYGLMALGKKADRNTMAARARGQDNEMTVTLVNNEEKLSQIP